MRTNLQDNNPSRHAFTLVELLVVISVIGILAGLVLSTSGYVQQKAARSRAESEIAAMEVALESYRADNGVYPQTDKIEGLYQALTGDGDSELGGGTDSQGDERGYGQQGKAYMELKPNMLSGTNIIDPWGGEYRYECPGEAERNAATFDLWSNAGGGDDEAKWITNW